MNSDIGGVCANDTVAHKPAANPWGTSWNFKYSLDSRGLILNVHSALSQRCTGVLLCAAHIWTGTYHPLLGFYKIMI